MEGQALQRQRMTSMTLTEREAAIKRSLFEKASAAAISKAPVFLSKQFNPAIQAGPIQQSEPAAPIEPVAWNEPEAITHEEIYQSPESCNHQWSDEDQALIDWFLQLNPEQLPTPPFKLSPFETVSSEQFYVRLRKDIVDAANGPQSRWGVWPTEKIRKLMNIVNDGPAKSGFNVRKDDILDIENTYKGDVDGNQESN